MPLVASASRQAAKPARVSRTTGALTVDALLRVLRRCGEYLAVDGADQCQAAGQGMQQQRRMYREGGGGQVAGMGKAAPAIAAAQAERHAGQGGDQQYQRQGDGDTGRSAAPRRPVAGGKCE